MNIKLSFERKTKKNHYRRYFAVDAENDCYYYVYTNNSNVTSVYKRINTFCDDYTEFAIHESKLPAEIVNYIHSFNH